MEGENFSLIVFIIKIINYLKRRFLLLIISIIIGIIIGFIQHYTSKDFYVTTFNLECNAVQKSKVINDINTFNTKLELDSINELSLITGIELSKLKTLKQIEYDTSNSEITIECYNYKIAQELSSLYCNHLKNTPFIINNINREREKYKQYLSLLNTKIEILDSLHSHLLIQNNNTNFYENNNGTFNEFISLYEKKIEVENIISSLKYAEIENNSITIINGKKSLIINVLKYSLLVLFFGFLVSIVLEIRRLIKNYE